MSQAQRYEALDSLRGIAACMVVLFHFELNSHFLFAGLIRHFNLFVDFFFVLSRFVMFEAFRDKLRAGFSLKRFILLRLGRVLIALVIFIAAQTFRFVEAPWRACSRQIAGRFEPTRGATALPTDVTERIG